jgi:hypothetical protein
MRKGDVKTGIFVVLAVVGIVAFYSEVQSVDRVSTDHEAPPAIGDI